MPTTKPTVPSLYYPIKPFHINQRFGDNLPCVKDYGLPTQSIVTGADNNTCPVGYTKLYKVFNMEGHDGTDLEAGVQNVYASYDGVVIEKQTDPRLGLGLGIVTNDIMDLGMNGAHYLKIRYWHLKSFKVEVGSIIKAGDWIGVSDNTGYSSGNHLHFEGVPMSKTNLGNYINVFPSNGYAGAIDIAPYFNSIYAQDITMEITYLTALVAALTALYKALLAKKG